MATIVTFETGTTAVNRPLTFAELDANFININNAILSILAGTGSYTGLGGGAPDSVYTSTDAITGGTP
jgi:hypothetical protein